MSSKIPVWKKEYEMDLKNAVKNFWHARNKQTKEQSKRQVSDTGTRGAVTGGQQMNGFIEIMEKVAIEVGVHKKCIFRKGNELPGYFRPTKDWDLLIISPKNHLIASFEFKSQVGSFGNNFNNRVEEALGSAVDVHTAFREKAFGTQEAPWLGYLIVVEKSEKSNRPVNIREPHFKVFKEFHKTSYLDRYKILCNKLVLERHYNFTCLIWTSNEKGKITHGHIDKDISFEKFVRSYAGFLIGKLSEFEE